MAGIAPTNVVIAFVVGLLPILFWLWFWLRNDKHPEPRRLLSLIFVAGAIVVPLIVPLQNILHDIIPQEHFNVMGLAAIEEVVKFIIVVIIVLPTKYINEPVDFGVYLVTAALGFAALENVMFLLNPDNTYSLASTIATANIRFIGATVLHGVAAAIIGISMGVVYYKGKLARIGMTFLGVVAAVTLHSLFNYFILQADQSSLITALVLLWIVGIIVVSMFRKLGQMRPPHYRTNH